MCNTNVVCVLFPPEQTPKMPGGMDGCTASEPFHLFHLPGRSLFTLTQASPELCKALNVLDFNYSSLPLFCLLIAYYEYLY